MKKIIKRLSFLLLLLLYSKGSPPKQDELPKMKSLHTLQELKRFPQSGKSGKKVRPR